MTEKQTQARNLYLHSELPQKQIAEMLDVDRKTLYLWVKKNRWAEMKAAAMYAPGVLLEQYYMQLSTMNRKIAQRGEDAYPTRNEADVIRKLGLQIRQIRDGQSASETIEVLENLIHRIVQEDVPLAQQVVEHADRYIKAKMKMNLIKPIADDDEEDEEAAIQELAGDVPAAGMQTPTQEQGPAANAAANQVPAGTIEDEPPAITKKDVQQLIESGKIVMPVWPKWETYGAYVADFRRAQTIVDQKIRAGVLPTGFPMQLIFPIKSRDEFG